MVCLLDTVMKGRVGLCNEGKQGCDEGESRVVMKGSRVVMKGRVGL